MHYYPFNPSAYHLSTSHWSEARDIVECEAGLLRDLAYRRLLDLYYGEEEPIPSKTRLVAIRIRMLRHEDIVASVLKEKFTLTDGFWRQDRAEEEIAKYQRKAAAARENGKKGGRPPKEKPKKNPGGSNSLATRTRTRTTKSPLPPEGELWWTEFWQAYPRTESKPAAYKAYAAALTRAESAEAIMAGLRRYIVCDQWTADPTKVPHASTWLNRDGWTGIPPKANHGAGAGNGEWWDTKQGILDKGMELGLPAPPKGDNNGWYDFMAAVWVKLGPGQWLDETSLAYPRYKRLMNGGV